MISIDYIRSKGGAWMVDVKQPSNFESLDQEQKQSLDEQLNQMISHKYQFISYNGLRFSFRKTHAESRERWFNCNYKSFQ